MWREGRQGRLGVCAGQKVARLCALAGRRRVGDQDAGEPLDPDYLQTLADQAGRHVAGEFSRVAAASRQACGSSGWRVQWNDRQDDLRDIERRIAVYAEWRAV